MKKSFILLLCFFALAACKKAEEAHTVAPAIRMESDASMVLLARQNNCTACHAVDKKLIGPAWVEVANKYKGDSTAQARLLIKVSKGGSGVWGSMPMPANDAIGKKQDQMKQLVHYILAMAK